MAPKSAKGKGVAAAPAVDLAGDGDNFNLTGRELKITAIMLPRVADNKVSQNPTSHSTSLSLVGSLGLKANIHYSRSTGTRWQPSTAARRSLPGPLYVTLPSPSIPPFTRFCSTASPTSSYPSRI